MIKENKDLKLIKETFLKNLVIVTGAPTAGKSMIGPIVSSLQRMENFKMSILLEHIGTLNHLGKLSDEVLIFLYRNTVDFMIYDNMIGRDMNFRFGDETSIWNTPDPEKYFERLLAERGEFVVDEMQKNRTLPVLVLSDAFWHVKKWFKAFSFLKMVYVGRHPVDTVYSWYNHRYGEEVKATTQDEGAKLTYGSETYNSKINQVLLTQVNDNVVPNYALGWEEKYGQFSEMDRVIYMIKAIRDNYAKALNLLSNEEREGVLFLTFDEIVTNTDHVLNKICAFLNTDRTSYTSFVLKREKCPRVLSEDARKNKLDKIKELATDEAFHSLVSMVDDYKETGI
jgi:hypothetical protein